MENEIDQILKEYYRKRLLIENCFGYKYDGTVDIRVKNLTKRIAKKISELPGKK